MKKTGLNGSSVTVAEARKRFRGASTSADGSGTYQKGGDSELGTNSEETLASQRLRLQREVTFLSRELKHSAAGVRDVLGHISVRARELLDFADKDAEGLDTDPVAPALYREMEKVQNLRARSRVLASASLDAIEKFAVTTEQIVRYSQAIQCRLSHQSVGRK